MCPHLKSTGPQELRCECRIVPLEDEGQSLTEIMSGRDPPREGGQDLGFIRRVETAGAWSSGNP